RTAASAGLAQEPATDTRLATSPPVRLSSFLTLVLAPLMKPAQRSAKGRLCFAQNIHVADDTQQLAVANDGQRTHPVLQHQLYDFRDVGLRRYREDIATHDLGNGHIEHVREVAAGQHLSRQPPQISIADHAYERAVVEHRQVPNISHTQLKHRFARRLGDFDRTWRRSHDLADDQNKETSTRRWSSNLRKAVLNPRKRCGPCRRELPQSSHLAAME